MEPGHKEVRLYVPWQHRSMSDGGLPGGTVPKEADNLVLVNFDVSTLFEMP